MSAVFFAHNYRFQTMEAEVFNADISNLCDSIRKRLRDYLSYNNAMLNVLRIPIRKINRQLTIIPRITQG